MTTNPSRLPQRRWNGQRRVAPAEALSARILRLRIARGYSAYELANEAGVPAGSIRLLECGKSADKRTLAALAAALGVPLCQLCAARTTAPNEPASPISLLSERALSTLGDPSGDTKGASVKARSSYKLQCELTKRSVRAPCLR